MAKYIDSGAFQAALVRKQCGPANQRYTDGWNDCLLRVKSMVSKAPAANVAPVVLGRWVHLGGDEWCCSACGFVITTEGSWDKPTKKYCEDCGAKMDIEDGGDSDVRIAD